MADKELESKMTLNNKFISNITFTENQSDPNQEIKQQNKARVISRQQIVNNLKSEKSEFIRSVEDTFKTTSGTHENTYVSITDSIYQSLDKSYLKRGKLPCPILVCNLLASHADTFRFSIEF